MSRGFSQLPRPQSDSISEGHNATRCIARRVTNIFNMPNSGLRLKGIAAANPNGTASQRCRESCDYQVQGRATRLP